MGIATSLNLYLSSMACFLCLLNIPFRHKPIWVRRVLSSALAAAKWLLFASKAKASSKVMVCWLIEVLCRRNIVKKTLPPNSKGGSVYLKISNKMITNANVHTFVKRHTGF